MFTLIYYMESSGKPKRRLIGKQWLTVDLELTNEMQIIVLKYKKKELQRLEKSKHD